MRWHEKTAELIGRRLEESDTAASVVSAVERERSFLFPDSVREWYSLPDATEILRQYSNDDSPVAARDLGKPFARWYNGGPRDFVSEGRLVFMFENQGVCQWSVELSGADDPPVAVIVDPGPHDDWTACARSFSDFVYCQVWDHPQWPYWIGAQLAGPGGSELLTLRQRYEESVRTFGWPGRTCYRFTCSSGRILLWDGEAAGGTDWQLMAPSATALEDLLISLWDVEPLRRALYSVSPESEQVLNRVKAGGA
jgi:hypothetical protein